MVSSWIGFFFCAIFVSKCSSSSYDSGYRPRGMVERTIVYAIGERPHPDQIYNTNEGRRDNKYHAHGGGYGDHSGYTSFSQTYYGKSRVQAKEYYPAPRPSYHKGEHKTLIFVGDRESPKDIYYTNRGRSISHGHGGSGYGGYSSGSGFQSAPSYQAKPSYHSGPTYQKSQSYHQGPSYSSGSSYQRNSGYKNTDYNRRPKGNPHGRELYSVAPVQHNDQYEKTSYSPPHMPHCSKVDAHFCDYNKMGHYAHPAEKGCYVQCDDYGNAYVRNCPYGTVWMRAPEQPHSMGFCG